MNAWTNFADADEQQGFDVIPNRTPVKVHMKIKPGGYNDPAQGWTGGFATRSDKTGAVYLACEFTVIGGRYNKRKVFSNIGLESPKGPKWGQMGRSFIRAALESAQGVKADDKSERAMTARRINGIGDLDGLEFAALVEVDKPQEGFEEKNIIQTVVGVGHKDYAALMDGSGVASAPAAQSAAPKASGSKPSWMQD